MDQKPAEESQQETPVQEEVKNDTIQQASTDAVSPVTAASSSPSSEAIPPATPLIVPGDSASTQQISSATSLNDNKQVKFSPRSLRIKIGLGVGLLLIILFGVSIFAAYGIIPIGKGATQTAFANFIIGLPFMPKTPNYVLTQSLQEHQKVTKFTFDASLATTSTDVSKMFGVGNFDMEIKGPVDYTNPDNPMASVHAQITKDFSSDIKVKDHIVYFRLNQFPEFLSAMFTLFGFPPGIENKFLSKWFYLDATPLDTEAQANLKQQEPSPETPQEEMNNAIAALDDPGVQKNISMKSDTLDSFSVYDVHFTPDPTTLDKLIGKLSTSAKNSAATRTLYTDSSRPSDYLEHFIMDTWIDKQSYVVRKIAISFTLKVPNASQYSSGFMQPSFSTQDKKYPVSFVIHFTNFGQPITVEVPQGAVKFDTFLNELMAQIATQSARQGGLFSSSALPAYPTQFQQANNIKRKSDVNALLNAIDQYAADNKGKLPPGITLYKLQIKKTGGVDLCSALVPKYLAELPVDPATNLGTPVTNCSRQYATNYWVLKSPADSRVTVSAPAAEDKEVISVTR